MKAELKTSVLLSLLLCLYAGVFIFLLRSYFLDTSKNLTFGSIALICVNGVPVFLLFYWLLRKYFFERNKNRSIRTEWIKIIKSEDNYKTLINRISDGFLSLDKNLRFTYANDRILEMTGKTPMEIIDKHILEVFPEAASSETFRLINKAREEQTYITNTDFYEPLNLWQENHIYPSNDGISLFIRDVSAKKRAEFTAKKSDKRFRALIENSEDIITMMDAEGIIIYVSPAFLRATGYTEEDIIGKPLFSFMPSENVVVSNDKLNYLLNNPGICFPAKNHLLTMDGSYLLISGTVSNFLQDENVRAIVCNFRDITDKEKTEAEIEEKETLYRNLFENMWSGFAYCELIYENASVTDYKYIAVNKAFETLTGLKNAAGKRALEIIPDLKNHHDFFKLINKVVVEQTVGSYELFIESLDKWFSASLYSPKKGYIVFLFEDITEKRKLDEEKSLFATIVTSSQDAIFSRTLDGTITSWNHSAEELFGYTEKEAIGMNAKEFIPSQNMKESDLTLEKLKKGQNVKHYETQRIKKDGTTVYVSLTISPILKEEQVVGASIIARDITDKKVAEEKIRYSQNNLTAIIENATEAFILMDKHLKIKAYNKKASDSPIVGFGPGKIEHGVYIADYVAPFRKDLLFSIHAKVMLGETVQYENDYYSTPEKKQWYSTAFTPVWENGEVNGICVAIRDITSKKLSQEKIIKSEENLRTIFDNALQAFILMDLDGTILSFNNHAVNHVRIAYETEIKTGMALQDIIDEKMRSFLKGIIAKTLSGETFQFSRAFETNRGKLIWLDFTISPVTRENKITGFCIVGSDITEKKMTEREREFERKNLESLINNTSDLMWSVDQNRRLISYNKPFGELVVHSTGNVITKDTDLLAIQYDEKTRREFKGFYERALAGESFTEIIKNESPQVVWSEISFYPIYNDRNVIGTACFLRNITERKKHEELLVKNANEKELFIQELSQNNKDLQQFAYITSHNLRGPIASLLGLSNLLENFTIDEPVLVQILDGIKKSTLRFDETIKDLNTILTVKDTPSVNRENLNLNATFKKVIEQCESFIRDSHAEISFDFSASPEINFNKSYLESIFLNLLTNALKYRDYARKLKITVKTEMKEDNIILKFSDNGIGMDTALHKDKIFKLYQRFHHNLEGKGLGLFLVKSQLEALGGSIDIESEINVGTQFTVHFRKTLSPVYQ